MTLTPAPISRIASRETGFLCLSTTREINALPRKIPKRKHASIEAKEYTVALKLISRIRVHTTSNAKLQNPETPKAITAESLPTVPPPGDRYSQYGFSSSGIVIQFTIIEYRAPVLNKAVHELRALDVLVERVYSPKNQESVLLNKGVALNDRYIRKLRDFISFQENGFAVRVIEPSYLTRSTAC